MEGGRVRLLLENCHSSVFIEYLFFHFSMVALLFVLKIIFYFQLQLTSNIILVLSV